MTIYLACTVRGDRGGVLAGRAICERLQPHGHDVLTTHLLADDVEAAESQITATDVYRRDLEWLTACDVLVAEASGSSYGVGFEVGYVLGRAAASGQRVVLLYDAARRDQVSRLITGNRPGACTTFGIRINRRADRVHRQDARSASGVSGDSVASMDEASVESSYDPELLSLTDISTRRITLARSATLPARSTTPPSARR